MSVLAQQQAAQQAWFVSMRSKHVDLIESWDNLENLAQKKLWHQLTLMLEEFIQNKAFDTGDDLVTMYSAFLKNFQAKLNQLRLMNILVRVSKQYTDTNEAMAFLKGIREDVAKEPEAQVMCDLAIARLKLSDDKVDECKELAEKAGATLDAMTGVEPQVHIEYYGVLTALHKITGPPGKFYKNALLFLSYTSVDKMSKDEKLVLAFDMGLAALLGDSIYNFGELLTHPIFNELMGSPYQWLAEILRAFNAGIIGEYEVLTNKYQAELNAQPALVANVPLLKQKITILSLLELLFHRAADNRTVTFAEIAQQTKLPTDEVEMLVMKALSAKLVKGVIDQVDQTVRFTWVQPRVLDKTQIATLQTRLNQWTDQVHQTVVFMDNETPELLA
jgi:26S proteasome regulatory subunit N9